MRIVEPDYYRSFRCSAGSCPDTCCAAWEVILDEETLEKYNAMPGEFGERVRKCIHFYDDAWMMRTQSGRCPMLTEDRLCDIQLHGSHEDLCRTCREYPKFVSEYGLLQERGLSLSCPEVCRMLLEQAEPVTLCRFEDDTPLTGTHDLDAETFLYLQKAREEALRLAQDRSLRVSQRAAAILIYAERLQAEINAGTFGDVPPIPHFSGTVLRPAIVRRTVRKWLRSLLQLEALPHGSWYSRLLDCLNVLDDLPAENAMQPAESELEAEQILVYYVYKFFLRGAYRGDILLQAKLICFCYCAITVLLQLTRQQVGRALTQGERIDVIHSFARELEHSEPNLHQICRRLCVLNCYSVDSFLRILQ